MPEAIAARLVEAMRRMPVIDTHEHLPPEADLVARPADVFTRIYCHYSMTSAISAGLAVEQKTLHDTSVPLEQRWARFRPYLDAMRDCGYARSAQATVRELYGCEDITDDNYQEISRRLQADNRPGIYDRILRGKCGIEVALNQADWKHPLMRRNTGEFSWLTYIPADQLRDLHARVTEGTGPLAGPEDFVRARLEHFRREGYVGMKHVASFPTDAVPDDDATGAYAKLKAGTLRDDRESQRLGTWMAHKAMELAPEYGMVVPVHCGIIYCCWCDFRPLSPLNVVPLVLRYRKTTFDLYHAGIPWVREIAVIGNQYPNVALNLVWCHQISPYMTEHMLNEWIDLVPANKIIGFAGDACDGPEKTVGALALARENIARALAVRIQRRQMSETRALDICRAWLYDNPRRIYGLA